MDHELLHIVIYKGAAHIYRTTSMEIHTLILFIQQANISHALPSCDKQTTPQLHRTSSS